MMARLDKQNLLKSINRIKVFFFQQQWKETLIFLFFLLLALGFWLMQNMQQEYEIEIFIPVQYNNVPEEMVLADMYPHEVVAKIRDKGNVLINYTWFQSFNPLEIDLINIRREGNHQVARRAIETSLSRQFQPSTSLLDFEPQTIAIEYNVLQDKEVTVLADVSVLLEPGYQISGTITVAPPKIHIYAKSHTLDSITRVKTEYTEIRRASQTQEIKLPLQKIAGVQMEPAEVTVTIPIEEFTEKRLTLAVEITDLPDNYLLRLFPSSVEVVCNVSISRFRELTAHDFEIKIPFREFEANQTAGKLPVQLTKHPSWITHPVVIPETIEFIIERNTR